MYRYGISKSMFHKSNTDIIWGNGNHAYQAKKLLNISEILLLDCNINIFAFLSAVNLP